MDFESLVTGDQNLQSEVEFQQSIIDEIKSARRAELKMMLNQIPVPPDGLGAIAKIGLVVGAIGLGALGYIWLTNDQAKAPITLDQTTVQVVDSQAIEITEPAVEELNTVAEAETKTNDIEQEKIVTNPEPLTVQETTPISIDAPEVVEGFSNADLKVEQRDVEMPIDKTIAVSPSIDAKLEIETRVRRRYDFHYQLEEGKLVLFGDFDDEPYQIIELKVDDNIEIYFYYKGEYHHIDKSKTEITPLKKISNESLINQLSQIKGRK